MSTTGPLGTQTPDLVVQGTITTAGGTSDPSSMVQVIGGEGASTWVADLRGTFSAGTTIVFEATANSQDWFAVAGMLEGSTSPTLVTFVAGPGPAVYTGSFAGNLGFRVRATSIAGGDAVIATLRLSTGVLAGFPSGGGGGGGTVNQGTPNTLPNAWPVELTDGTNGPAAIKPGGSPAIATDAALVVDVRPDTTLTTQPSLPTAPRLQSVAVNVSASGNNTLIAGVSGQTIRVFKLLLVFSMSTTATFQDGASTALDGAMSMAAGGSITLDLDTEPWFLTSVGNDFVLNLGTAGAVGGRVYYTQS